MKSSLCYPPEMATTQSRRVCRPSSNLFEGFCMISQDLDPYVVRACRLSTQAPRAFALVGSPPPWDNPVSWVFSPLLGEPQQPMTVGLLSSPQFDQVPVKARAPVSESKFTSLSIFDGSFVGLIDDRRWVPPWEVNGNGFLLSLLSSFSSLSLCTDVTDSGTWTTILLRSDGSDERWVPPWNDARSEQLWSVTSDKSLILWLLSIPLVGFTIPVSIVSCYVLDFMISVSKSLTFLQGLLSHVESKIYDFMVVWPAIVPYFPCASCEYVLLVKSLGWNYFGARFYNLDIADPLSPPTPNIGWEFLDAFHMQWHCYTMHQMPVPHTEMLRPVLSWFEFSGLQPPWQVQYDTTGSNWQSRNLSRLGFDSFGDPLKQSVVTAARKHCGAVYDGTIAQIFVFVVCCLRWGASMIFCLPDRRGSSNILGHGWELDSDNVKTLVLWVANLNAWFNGKLSSKRLYECVSWLVLHFMHLLCKLLNLI